MDWVEEIAKEAAKELAEFAVKELTDYGERVANGESWKFHAGQKLMRMHSFFWGMMARMREQVRQKTEAAR